MSWLSIFKRSKKKPVTMAQRKRATMEYRKEYFKRNPGLLGQIWFCAYCGGVLRGEHEVEVDHITPLNSKYGQNKKYNLVSSCRPCNRSKSDIVDTRVFKGYWSKGWHSILFQTQKILLVLIIGAYYIFRFLLKAAYQSLATPFRNGTTKTKLIFFIIYFIVFIFVLDKLRILDILGIRL